MTILIGDFKSLVEPPSENPPEYDFDAHVNGLIYHCEAVAGEEPKVWVYSPGAANQPTQPLYTGDKAKGFAQKVSDLALQEVLEQRERVDREMRRLESQERGQPWPSIEGQIGRSYQTTRIMPPDLARRTPPIGAPTGMMPLSRPQKYYPGPLPEEPLLIDEEGVSEPQGAPSTPEPEDLMDGGPL